MADRGTPMLDALVRSICGTRNIRCCIAQYVHLASSLSAVPNDVPTAVMTHDVIHRLADQDVELAEKRVCTAEEEADMLRHAGTIIAINNAEHDLLASMLPDREVVTVGMAVDQPPTIVAPPTGPPCVLFIGAANPMNVHGIETFIDVAWPTIREAHPSARLRLVGNVCTAITTTSSDDGVELAGPVDDLQAEYAGASVVINCTVMGTGLKIKCIEALGHGCPLVTTPNGAEGIPGRAGHDWIVAPDVTAMGPEIGRLLGDDHALSRLRSAAADIASTALHPTSIYGPLWQAIGLKEVPHHV